MRLRLFSFLLFVLLALPAMAQSDLAIGRVLDGRYRKLRATSDVTIAGERVKEYGLVLYHSLTVTDDAGIMDDVLEAFLADQTKAVAKDLSYVGAHLYYGFCQFRPAKDEAYNRYAFVKDLRHAPEAQEPKVIIIYMEGPASLQMLKQKFSK